MSAGCGKTPTIASSQYNNGSFISITAAGMHVVGSFIVIFNSARLVRFGEELTPYVVPREAE